MKNIIILGAARAGKTTLAKILHHQFQYSIISIDSFVSALQDAFPELGISHSNTDNKFRLLPPFVYSYMEKIVKEYPEEKFVLEGWHVYPNEICKLFDKRNVKIICLGYPQISCEKALQLLREKEQENSYTKKMTNEEVKRLLSNHIEYSKKLKKQCEENEIQFYDTSYEREKILGQIIEDLMKENS